MFFEKRLRLVFSLGFSLKEDVMHCNSRLPMLAATSLGIAAACGSAAAGDLPASMWNFNPYWPSTAPPGFTGGPSDFEVFLQGDQVGIASTHFSSFYGGAPGEMGSGRGTGPVTYDPTTNQTTLEFYTSPMAPADMSTIPLNTGMPCACGGDNTVPHFGLSAEVPGDNTGGELIPPLKMEWTWGSSGTLVVPTVGVGMSSTGDTGQIYYLIEYATVTSGAESTGNYTELPYQGSYTFKFIGSGGPVTLSDAGYFISPTEIPLSDLNLSDEPPTNSPFSPFTPQPGLDGPIPGIPEPVTWVMLLLGVFGVGAASRCRGQRIGLHA